MEIKIDIHSGTYRHIGSAVFSTPEEVEEYMKEVKKLDKEAVYILKEVNQK
jgi:Uri superfamily endonuclease